MSLLLLVEDSPTVASSLRAMLEQAGCQVALAETGEEALSLAGPTFRTWCSWTFTSLM